MESFNYTAKDTIENEPRAIEKSSEISEAEMERLQNCLDKNPTGPRWWNKAKVLMSTLSAAAILTGCDSNQRTNTEKPSDASHEQSAAITNTKAEPNKNPEADEVKIVQDIPPTEPDKIEPEKPKEKDYQTQIINIIGKLNPKTDYIFEESSETRTINSSELLSQHTFKFEESDKTRLKELRESAIKHKLNYITTGMSQEEIDNLYKKTLVEIDNTEKNRSRLESLNFNLDNDWRLNPYVSIVKELTRAKIDKASCVVKVEDISSDIVCTSNASTNRITGHITLSSKTLCEILDPENPNHTDAVTSYLHELTHSLRHQEYRDQESKGMSIYEIAFAKGEKIENYVTGDELPESILKIIESWVSDIELYNLDLKGWKKILDERTDKERATRFYNSIGGSHDQEVEAFIVSTLGIKYIKSHGLHFRDPSKNPPEVVKETTPGNKSASQNKPKAEVKKTVPSKKKRRNTKTR